LWGDGDPERVRQRAAEEMKNTARAAKLLGVNVVNGFTGSSVWSKLYFFPPTSQADIDAGYRDFADRWVPILDVCQENDVKFGLEVHPTEIAYDIITMQRAIKAVNGHPAFGSNFDPSHLIHHFIDPVEFITAFADRIFHVHVKDSRVQLTGRNSILASHLDFGDARRGWDFVSPGRGDVKLDPIVRALNRIGYQGPLSIEWEDSGMDREFGAPEALAYVRRTDFAPSAIAFDAAFTQNRS
jgi:sugar phosphate isomerase/epimerase